MRALLLAALLAPALALAEPYAVGDTLPPARFDDQHGRTHTLHEHVRVVVFSRDTEGETTARFPSRSGQVTVLVLEDLRIANVQFHPEATGLRDALSALAMAPAAAPAAAPPGH
jgi:hypothetical protein